MIKGLTKSQVSNLIEFIEFNFINSIRNDTEIDNIDYVVDMMDTLTKLRTTLEYIGEDDSKTEPPYAYLMAEYLSTRYGKEKNNEN